jgi:hypothetical protein
LLMQQPDGFIPRHAAITPFRAHRGFDSCAPSRTHWYRNGSVAHAVPPVRDTH